MKITLMVEREGTSNKVSELNIKSSNSGTNLFLSKVYACLHELDIFQSSSTRPASEVLSSLHDELSDHGLL